MRILSFGGGVQTTALFLLAHNGKCEMMDHIIFADTQGESEETYSFINKLKALSKVPFHVVTNGSLEQAYLEGKASIPVYIDKQDGKPAGRLIRSCTDRFKVRPVYYKARELLGLKKYQRYKGRVDIMLGISIDETHRMTENTYYPWIHNTYPLIDLDMNRQACLDYIAEKGIGMPPRSSCYYCPYHSDKYWATMPADEFKRAVEFDKKVRRGNKNIDKDAYLHWSLKPLDEVWFKHQPEQFGEECDGYCNT